MAAFGVGVTRLSVTVSEARSSGSWYNRKVILGEDVFLGKGDATT